MRATCSVDVYERIVRVALKLAITRSRARGTTVADAAVAAMKPWKELTMKIYILCVLACVSVVAACIEPNDTEHTQQALTSEGGIVPIGDVLVGLESMHVAQPTSVLDADIKGGLEYSSLDELQKLWWDNGCQALPGSAVCTTIEVAMDDLAEKPTCQLIWKIKGAVRSPTITECTVCCVKQTNGTQKCTTKCKAPVTISF